MTDTHNVIRPRTWALLILIIVLAAGLRLAGLDYAPVGGHGDVAWKGINALDWLDRGAFPYYVWELYAPEPVIVMSTALMLPFTGVSFMAGRLVTVIWGVLLVFFLFQAAYWLLADAPRERREWAGLMAAAAGALSLHANYLSRLGMRAAIFPALCALLVWLVAWAWARGGWPRWTLAGVALAFMQYTYIPGRLIPLVLALWWGHGWFFHRDQWRTRWRGWLVLAVVAVVLSLPNIYTFITTPEAFTARADTGTAETGGWIWQHDTDDGLLSVLIGKIGLELAAFGIYWNGPYSMMNSPMLTPLFFAGFVIGVGLMIARPRQIATMWPALALPVMFSTDLISGAVVEIHGLRQTGVLAFACILAGVGLGTAIDWVLRLRPELNAQPRLIVLLVAVALFPTLMGMQRYLGEYIPAQYANPDNSWRTEQTDVDISRRLILQSDHAYLIPYDEYNRANIAFLTSAAFRERHSPVTPAGELVIPNPPERIIVLTAADPHRIRHDGRESLWDTRLWVLLRDGEALFLPPLLPAQESALLAALDATEPERLIDRSDTEIARLYAIPAPADLFAPRPVIAYPVDAAFALPGEANPAEIRLVGYTLPAHDLTPGAVIYVTLYWETLHPPGEDYEIFVQIWDDAGGAVAGTHDFPNGGMYRTRIWRQDELTITHHRLRLPDSLDSGAYTLAAGLYRVLHNEPLPASGANAGQHQMLARDLRYVPQIPPASETPTDTPLQFADMLALAGFDALDGTTAAPGESLTLALDWSVLARPPLDYSVFLHLTDTDDSPPVAQADIPLGSGAGIPSAVWYPGDHWRDTLTLHLPDDLPPGAYTLWLGVYYYADGVRLTPLLNGDAQPDGWVQAGTLHVE